MDGEMEGWMDGWMDGWIMAVARIKKWGVQNYWASGLEAA